MSKLNKAFPAVTPAMRKRAKMANATHFFGEEFIIERLQPVPKTSKVARGSSAFYRSCLNFSHSIQDPIGALTGAAEHMLRARGLANLNSIIEADDIWGFASRVKYLALAFYSAVTPVGWSHGDEPDLQKILDGVLNGDTVKYEPVVHRLIGYRVRVSAIREAIADLAALLQVANEVSPADDRRLVVFGIQHVMSKLLLPIGGYLEEEHAHEILYVFLIPGRRPMFCYGPNGTLLVPAGVDGHGNAILRRSLAADPTPPTPGVTRPQAPSTPDAAPVISLAPFVQNPAALLSYTSTQKLADASEAAEGDLSVSSLEDADDAAQRLAPSEVSALQGPASDQTTNGTLTSLEPLHAASPQLDSEPQAPQSMDAHSTDRCSVDGIVTLITPTGQATAEFAAETWNGNRLEAPTSVQGESAIPTLAATERAWDCTARVDGIVTPDADPGGCSPQPAPVSDDIASAEGDETGSSPATVPSTEDEVHASLAGQIVTPKPLRVPHSEQPIAGGAAEGDSGTLEVE